MRGFGSPACKYFISMVVAFVTMMIVMMAVILMSMFTAAVIVVMTVMCMIVTAVYMSVVIMVMIVTAVFMSMAVAVTSMVMITMLSVLMHMAAIRANSGSFKQLVLQRMLLFHGIQYLLSGQLIPRRCDQSRLVIMLTDQSYTFLKLVLAYILGTA